MTDHSTEASLSETPVDSAEPVSESSEVTSVESSLEESNAEPAAQGRRVREFFSDLMYSLFSPDAPTRKAAVWFFVGIIGMIVVSIVGVQHVRKARALRALEEAEMEKQRKAEAEAFNSRLSDLKIQESTLSLGRIVVTLQRVSEKRGKSPSADFELVIRCSSKEVREYIEARSVQVRSELSSSLVGMTRDDFLTPQGKIRTRKKILTTLNQWLVREFSGARIEDMWFADLVVE